MEMAEAAARIGEKRKWEREGFCHLPLRPMAYFYPLLHSPPKFRASPPIGKQDSFCDDFCQALVCVGDSQIPSQVPDSQPAYDSKVAVTPLSVSDLVARVAAKVAAMLATTKNNKNRREADKALKFGQKGTGTMKWLPFMSSFVLEKMCGLIKTGVRTGKGFKEVHLTTVAKGLFYHYGVSVCSTQDNPTDAEFLNVPIANYDEMHTILSFGLATGKYAMGSSEPLGLAATIPSPEDAETQESVTVNLDGPLEKDGDAPEKVTAGKRKRGAFTDDELVAFTNMTVVVKDVAQAIRDNKPTDMHPDLYNAVMDMLGFAEDDLMATLSHLIDHKAQGSSFIGMIEPHRVLWLRTTLARIYIPWRVYQDQVNGYSNNSYRGYETLEEAHQEYLTFLEEEFLEDQAIDEAVPLVQLPPKEVHALQGASPMVRPCRVKDYIIPFLIMVIVRILFF
ncbi:hypothetical protein QYE76_061264 [Lolium multiflorum]|uniref:Ribonuclease H1 N-terminal domain-containing protein n=1 Tax=Lolium multiflorum TaxID=4521 RepID=A0AAD8W711_LOLMU|nr:hypothetical protein QYE76_061264 [Lolium multiflorum]